MNVNTPMKTLVAALLLANSSLALAAPTEVTMWRHETGDAEMQASEAAVNRFNASQDRWEILVEKLPEGSYTESITAAALANTLPCVFDMDQPTVPNFAWSGYLRPISDYLSQDFLDGLNTGAKGQYKGQVYSVGQFDVALTLFTRKSILERFDIRYPTLEAPWTKDELMAAIKKIKASGEFAYPFDVNTNWTGEWSSYGYGPLLQSFGADLIDRDNYLEAEGTLNGDAAVQWGEWFQSLFEQEFADRKPADDKRFQNGKIAIHYTGSWSAKDYTDAFGDDLAILPPPDLGHGPVVGGGSWQWGISSSCKHPEGAAEFVQFLMSDEEVAEMSEKTSLIPTSSGGAALTEQYSEGGEWRIFYEFSEQYTVMRPETPAYPVISSAFDKAAQDIIDGVDPQDALDNAVDTIELNIEDNGGYGF
ncbi:ABC transporter substrate-binding protein [Reinekea marinisedimentorum]|uniref:Multiple sugar transport system substrate-binding protein n=1 Tax=Reinekea marinisedimentorum TaxID=230495 RepID=A0A4R3I526_9GAMM|nr:sugar ABC transporter substrate-binding protein [Reinekea marinisedimentorum]TCS40352.1 multiple sugar transport system substrate-binding protein [Reinekea marinisedimentorum]